MIQTKSYFLALGRWGAFFIESIPLVLIKNGFSLSAILISYSCSTVLFHMVIFLTIVLILKQYRSGLVLLISLTLTYRHTFLFGCLRFVFGIISMCINLCSYRTYN